MPVSIDFDATSGTTAKINYSVPLPGQNSGKRYVQLDLGIDPETGYLEKARNAGRTFAESAGISRSGSAVNVDKTIAANFLRDRLLSIGHDPKSVERAVSHLPRLLETQNQSGGIGDPIVADDDEIIISDPIFGDPRDLVANFAAKAIEGKVVVPGTGPGGSGTTTEVVDEETPDPQLFLVETYGVSSFLGDYGMGRTVRTFTLLPGESTTIRLKTWQSTKESRKHSSSIIDSHEQSAKERFATKLQDETTDKQTKSKSRKWAVEAEAKASWGWGSAKVKASAEGESHSAREQFARSASESVGEHSRDASSKREMSITSSSETEIEIGEETSIERVINNVNMRRVLNFVFRELNQTYSTKLHLKNIHVAYSNGLENTWRQVPLSGLRELLIEVLNPNNVDIDEIAQRILKVAGTVMSLDDTPVRILETVTYDSQNDTVEINEATLDATGNYAPPTENFYYRVKKGALAQENHSNPVDGVLLSEQTIVMRTDSVIVEALLGQSDALDNYAMEIQEAAAGKDTIANERDALLLSTLAAIGDPIERAKAAAELFANSGKDDGV